MNQALDATCDGTGATRPIDPLAPAGAPGPIAGPPRGGFDPILDPIPSIAPISAPVAIPGGEYGEVDAMEGAYGGDTVSTRKLSMTKQQESAIQDGAMPKSAILDGLYSRTLLQDTCNVSTECIDQCEGCEVHAKYCTPLVVDLLCVAVSSHVAVLTGDDDAVAIAAARLACVHAVSGACAELDAACQQCNTDNGGVCTDLACCPGETGDVCGQGCCCCPFCMVPSGRTCECVTAPCSAP